MKKILLSSLTFLLSLLLANAQQVPNASFDIWTNASHPDGWYTFSSGGVVNLASRDTTTKVEGSASAKIQSATISGQTTYEILSLGTANWTFSTGYTYYPIAFSFRPDTFSFAYTYTSPGTDTATAYIKFIKGNGVLLDTTIDLVLNAQWSFPSLVLTSLYANANTPDSVLIQFKSSKLRGGFFGVAGSTLHVDALHFGYKSMNSAVSNINSTIQPKVMPNPFQYELSFTNTNNELIAITIYNMLGQPVMQQSFTHSTTLNTAQLQAGVYFYHLKNANGIITSGKIIRE